MVVAGGVVFEELDSQRRYDQTPTQHNGNIGRLTAHWSRKIPDSTWSLGSDEHGAHEYAVSSDTTKVTLMLMLYLFLGSVPGAFLGCLVIFQERRDIVANPDAPGKGQRSGRLKIDTTDVRQRSDRSFYVQSRPERSDRSFYCLNVRSDRSGLTVQKDIYRCPVGQIRSYV